MPVHLALSEDRRTVSWEYQGSTVTLEHDRPVRTACVFTQPPSVVVVEGWWTLPGGYGPGPRGAHFDGTSNAVVYDLDGSERVRLAPPDLRTPIGFDQVFPASPTDEAVFSAGTRDVHGEPDLVTGEVRNWREWR